MNKETYLTLTYLDMDRQFIIPSGIIIRIETVTKEDKDEKDNIIGTRDVTAIRLGTGEVLGVKESIEEIMAQLTKTFTKGC